MLTLLKNNKILNGIILSYGQIFFSNSYLFSVIILLITFIHPNIAICGLICTLTSLTFASLFKLDKNLIKNGYYSYNSLLVGLGLGAFYKLSLALIIVLTFASFITLLIQISIQGILNKYNLYVLSFPFVFSFIIIQISIRNSLNLNFYEDKLFLANYYNTINSNLDTIYYFLNEKLYNFWIYFFKSLSSIIFLDDVISGIIIFFVLLIYSRISATLSLIGFTSSYLTIFSLGLFDKINTLFVGFNFILLSIALGGFFIIPSVLSYITVLILSSISVFITIFLNEIFSLVQISSYSLPFSIITNTFLYFVFYTNSKFFKQTYIQEYRPEYNLYRHKNFLKRFYGRLTQYPLILPFWGKWKVWQGYDDEYTHIEDYKYALDFVIEENNSTFKNYGTNLSDYYCYNQLIISPGYGYVVKIVDNIPDNVIGDVNTKQNWGNSIIIKHSEFLYTQLSHLKEGSFLVKEGDYVYTGQPIARVGNSGRSPQPHLHFQVQMFPNVGSKPSPYPIIRYKKYNHNNNEILFKYAIPQKNEIIENVTILLKLSNAFKFIPGLEFKINLKNKTYPISVYVDSLNNTYLYCHSTRSILYVYNDYYAHYFSNYIGKKNSPLYFFYLSCFSVEFSDVKNLEIYDEIPIHHIFDKIHLFIHDFVSPFFMFKNVIYKLNYEHFEAHSILRSTIILKKLFKKQIKYEFEILITSEKLQKIKEKNCGIELIFLWNE